MIKGINVGEDIYKTIHIISIKVNDYITSLQHEQTLLLYRWHMCIMHKASQVGMTQLHIDHKCMWPQPSLA